MGRERGKGIKEGGETGVLGREHKANTRSSVISLHVLVPH